MTFTRWLARRRSGSDDIGRTRIGFRKGCSDRLDPPELTRILTYRKSLPKKLQFQQNKSAFT